MSSPTSLVQDCTSLPTGDRCDAALPDNPQCTLNYHFGQLLGVDDFRAEQGFHVGRARRHQRLLHGHGVVAGYPVSYKSAISELRVGPGLAIDGLGRDLQLDADQCVNLAKWWAARVAAKDAGFADLLDKIEFTIDLDLVVCYATCLTDPVPAIAEPCAGAASDLAYSRVCETVRLQLVRHVEPKVPPTVTTLPDTRDALIDALAQTPIAPPDSTDPQTLCLVLARLDGVHFKKSGQTWQVDINNVDLHVRQTLLATSALQSLLLPALDTPAPPAGPLVLNDKVAALNDTVTLPFDQKLAGKSVQPGNFAITQFDPATGWATFIATTATYTEPLGQPPQVALKLDGPLVPGRLTRICVVGFGPTPLLGASLIPVGASRDDRDGRVLTITIH
jgi:hypothetical protein